MLSPPEWSLYEWITAAGAAVSVLLFAASTTRWGRQRVLDAWRWLRRDLAGPPRKTLRAVSMRDNSWWIEIRNQKPYMRIAVELYVTNISDRPVFVASAQFLCVFPAGRAEARLGLPDWIASGQTSRCFFDFSAQPPFRKVGVSLSGRVVLTDNFGNKYRSEKLIATARNTDEEPPPPPPPQEDLFSIHPGYVRSAVAVLKDEVSRYRKCGRQAGGFGSIFIMQGGQKVRGLGGDWRKLHSPSQQLIMLPEPEHPIVRSDNLDAILRIYAQCNSDEREILVRELLARVVRNSEYAPVGYFVALVMTHLGRLPEAIDSARSRLRGDSQYGFDDVGRLLGGMLKYDHKLFDDDALEATSALALDLSPPAYDIKERCAAILAFRGGAPVTAQNERP